MKMHRHRGRGRYVFLPLILLIGIAIPSAVVAQHRETVAKPIPGPKPATNDELLYQADLAKVHLQHGHPEQAILILEQVVARGRNRPELPRWKTALASAYLQSGEEEKGLGILRELGQSERLAVRTLANLTLGRHYESRGEPKKALGYYESVALHADGKFQRSAARKHITRVVTAMSNGAEQLARYEEMLGKKPDDLPLLQLIAEVSSRVGGGPGRALELLRKLHQRRPDDPEIWIEYIRSAEAAGQLEEAVEQYKALREQRPVYNQFCCENLARIAKMQGRPDEVSRWVAESARGMKEGPMLSLRLGKLYAVMDMPAQAEKFLRAVIESADTEGQKASATVELARLLITGSRPDEAVQLLEPLQDARWRSIREQATQLLAVCRHTGGTMKRTDAPKRPGDTR